MDEKSDFKTHAMKGTILPLLIACLFNLHGCATVETLSPVDDYELYTAFWDQSPQIHLELEEAVFLNITDTRNISFSKEPPWEMDVLQRLPNLRASTIQSFELNNQVPLALEAEKFLKYKKDLISKEELARIIDTTNRIQDPNRPLEEQFDDFFHQFPNSLCIATFSRVGVSEDGKQALLLFTSSWFFGPGMDQLVLFERIDGEWILTKRVVKYID